MSKSIPAGFGVEPGVAACCGTGSTAESHHVGVASGFSCQPAGYCAPDGIKTLIGTTIS
jgi:hypothetical protein